MSDAMPLSPLIHVVDDDEAETLRRRKTYSHLVLRDVEVCFSYSR